MRYRKEIQFRYQCFLAGIVAADYRNAHRTNESDKLSSPLEYVGCEEMTEEEKKKEQEVRNKESIARLLSCKNVTEKK
jgi:hypothetical protein